MNPSFSFLVKREAINDLRLLFKRHNVWTGAKVRHGDPAHLKGFVPTGYAVLSFDAFKGNAQLLVMVALKAGAQHGANLMNWYRTPITNA